MWPDEPDELSVWDDPLIQGATLVLCLAFVVASLAWAFQAATH